MNSTDKPCKNSSQLQNGLIKEPQITDVIQFFFTITEKYETFEREIRKIIDSIDAYSPGQIADECARIKAQRDKLSVMDDQMFAIIELAGNEIAQNPMVDEYRVAFAKANIACNTLYQKLLEVRTSLQEVSCPAYSEQYG